MGAGGAWATVSVLATLLLLRVSEGVFIEDLRVPAVVEHNANATAVLDCVYDLAARESDLVTVKWFFKDENHLVYQWGKGLAPAGSGILRGRLDLEHIASRHALKKHRALIIQNPTIELSGNYICKVSTKENVVTGTKKMIVYAPARTMNLTQERNSKSSINISCSAEGAFPVPRLDIYMKQESRQTRIRLKKVKSVASMTEEGVFDATAHVHLLDSEIDPLALFECMMTIPDTQYSLKRVIKYHRGGKMADTSAPPLSSHPALLTAGVLLLCSCSLCDTC
ncbi:uncharacterized protein LOC122385285 [Amphibalanus amphitrite]|uniref:uncharacterized protein LOC122385285 n=1 Tax=Amphibalanus amphitrite TaxID=1232801 RepID=UPI001C9201CA|nr:uncharacterized protein LOC122385285 [Amphibalanus amphitrite]